MELRHKYRRIELSTWKRRQHFELFARGEYPYDGVTTNIDVTRLVEICRETDHKFFTAFMYVVARAINSIENFRYRVYEDQIVLCDQIDPSFNVLNPDTELYYFAYTVYNKDYQKFAEDVEAAKDFALKNNYMANNRLDVFYISCLPWFGFTDIIQPMGLAANNSIPRLVWGRYQEIGERVDMPFSVTTHHGFVDGLHIARLLEKMQALMDEPSFLRT